MSWSLVCPTSRGIGFHLARQILQTTELPVVATARRNPERVEREILDGLKDVDSKRLTVLEVDVTDESTIEAAASKTKLLFPSSKNSLHLSFIVPGVLYPEKSPSQLSQSELTHTFATNTIGPMLLAKHFTAFLPRKSSPALNAKDSSLPPRAVWTTMSARVGSTSDNRLGGWYGYRASKAGVNSFTKSLDLWIQNRCGERGMAVAYHPGTVKTGLSEEFWGNVRKEKLFEPEWAAGTMLDVIRRLSLDSRGRCWDWDGKEVMP